MMSVRIVGVHACTKAGSAIGVVLCGTILSVGPGTSNVGETFCIMFTSK